MADTFDPTIVKGDTLRWQMSMTDSSGVTSNLTGVTLTLQVRKSYYPGASLFNSSLYVTSGSTLYTLNGIYGGISATGTGGLVNLCVGSTYTSNFSEYSGAFYDVQGQLPNNGGIITYLRGKINVLPEVTKT